MTKLLLILILFTCMAGDRCCIRLGGLIQPVQTSKPPMVGCNKDLKVHYKNNCGKTLIVYFLEVNPGTTILCESLVSYGNIYSNQSREFTINKGKLGYFVFAEDPEGQCTGGHRKAEAWVNCERSTSDNAFFDVCN